MLVSILIPCFNARDWVGAAIESALAQTWGEREVIVVDDGSTDGSLDVIRQFGDHVRWETGPNRGGGVARNRLLELACGEWVQYLDADDVLLPEKIATQALIVMDRPDIDVLCSPTLLERVQGDRPVRVPHPFPKIRDPWAMLALWQLPQTGGPLWRRAALESVGGWKADQPCCQEHELYERLLEAGCQFAFNDEMLAVYREWNLGDRLVRRLIKEIPKQRLLILDRMERFLDANGLKSKARRQALNDARHQLARWCWASDATFSRAIIRRITESDPLFHPSRGIASPPAYRFAYRLLGFPLTQKLAGIVRDLNPNVALTKSSAG